MLPIGQLVKIRSDVAFQEPNGTKRPCNYAGEITTIVDYYYLEPMDMWFLHDGKDTEFYILDISSEWVFGRSEIYPIDHEPADEEFKEYFKSFKNEGVT